MAKKKNELVLYLLGFLLIFGISGLIYGLIPYPFIIGSISTIISFILISIIVLRRKIKRKR